jgi:DNA-binding transcriptional LysR family regulator
LISFIEVCKDSSITGAAKTLHLTQPAISQHIKQLEQEYEARLFVRSNRSLSLTKEGEILLKYALRIQSLYGDLERKLRDNKKYASYLTIGITHTSESNVAPEILEKYAQKDNVIHIRIISDSIKNLYDKLSNFQIDMAIIEGKITNKKFSSILLGTDSLVAIVSPAHPLAKKKVVSVNDLKKENLILRTLESGTSTLFASELAKMGESIDDFHLSLEIDSVTSIKELIRKNLGISILPRSTCSRQIKEKKLVALPIENMDLSRETNLVFIDGNIERNVLEDIVSIYRERIQ